MKTTGMSEEAVAKLVASRMIGTETPVFVDVVSKVRRYYDCVLIPDFVLEEGILGLDRVGEVLVVSTKTRRYTFELPTPPDEAWEEEVVRFVDVEGNSFESDELSIETLNQGGVV